MNPTLAQYLRRRVLKKVIPVACLLVSIAAPFGFYGVLKLSATSHESVLKSHLSEFILLTEIQDRVELNRILSGLALQGESEVKIIKNLKVFATSSNLDQIDRFIESPDESSRFSFLSPNTSIDFKTLTIRSTLNHKSKSLGDQNILIVMETPLKQFASIFISICLVLTLSMTCLIWIVIRENIKASTRAMRPIQEVVRAVERLSQLQANLDQHQKSLDIQPLSHWKIAELDLISKSIERTRTILSDTKNQLMEEKAASVFGKIFQSIVHDLNNVSVRIANYTENLEASNSDLTTANQSTLLLIESANDILSIIESGKELLEQGYRDFCTSDLRETVRQALLKRGISTVNSTYMGKSVEVHLPSDPVMIAHSPALMMRALNNLISNAIQSANDVITINVQLLASELRIGVSNDGVGLSEIEFCEHASGSGRSMNGNRRSLGIILAKLVAEYHGGELKLSKNLEQGTFLEMVLSRRSSLRAVAS